MSTIRRKGKPYNPATAAHDRRSSDLLRNAVVAEIEIDDPYEKGAKLVMMRSLRDDPLARLHARKQIDEAQYEAGKQYREEWEKAERGPRAIDPSKEYVDGGQFPEPLTEVQRAAVASLTRVGRILGIQTEHVLRRVLCGNLFPGQVAAELGLLSPRDAEHMAWLFRQGLEILAKEYGFVLKRFA
jgi:hypothetical protein